VIIRIVVVKIVRQNHAWVPDRDTQRVSIRDDETEIRKLLTRIYEIQMLPCISVLEGKFHVAKEYKVVRILAETWNKISIISKQIRNHGYFNFSFTHKYIICIFKYLKNLLLINKELYSLENYVSLQFNFLKYF